MKIIVPRKIPFKILAEIGINYLRQAHNSTRKRESALHLQQTLLNFIETDCSSVVKKYKNISIDTKDKKIERIIWLLWWQEDTPSNPVISACIDRALKIRGFEVRVLTKDNISKYIYIDDMVELYEKNRIYIQHLADMVRIRLLRKYGGIWLDASIAVIDENYFDWIVDNYPFFSNHFAEYDLVWNVGNGKYSTYFWATFKDNPLFAFVDDMMTTFIIRHKGVIDYTHFDYSVMVGYKNIDAFRTLIDAIPPNNPNMWWLQSRLLNKFDEKEWNLVTKDTHLLKLSSKNLQTYYSKNILSGTYWDYIVNVLWKE